MNDTRLKIRPGDIIDGQTGIVEHRLVRVDLRSVCIVDDDALGYRIGDLAELAFVPTQLLLCLLTVFDVGAGGVPFYDVACVSTQRLRAYEKPPIYTILPTKAHLDLPRLS